jgi:integrase/recombinase XerD
MQNRAIDLTKSDSTQVQSEDAAQPFSPRLLPSLKTQNSGATALSLREIEHYCEDWLYDAEYRQQSPKTIKGKRNVVAKRLWFLKARECERCGTTELRRFLTYVANGHLEEGGRWGSAKLIKPPTPRTIQYYYIYLQGFFHWLEGEEIIESSPLVRLEKPKNPNDGHIQPFSRDDVTALIQAAEQSRFAERDEAMVRFLLDTAVRAAELCTLKMQDIDLAGRRAEVVGKGRKRRQVFFGRNTARALRHYLRHEPRKPDSPIFTSCGGNTPGQALTPNGLLHIINYLGRRAGIQTVRVSPHTFRHTFAVDFLRNGGNVFSLQQILGHNSLSMTQRYVSLAQADIEHQHRQFAPGDRL